MKFELVTPERVVFQEEAEQVTLPTTQGEITILPGHIPLVATLAAGIAKLKKNGQEEEVAVSGGFIEVLADGTVRVLADTAERGHELNLHTIEEAQQRAAEVMRSAVTKDDVSYAAAAAAMEREMARYRVAKRAHARRSAPGSGGVELADDENPV